MLPAATEQLTFFSQTSPFKMSSTHTLINTHSQIHTQGHALCFSHTYILLSLSLSLSHTHTPPKLSNPSQHSPLSATPQGDHRRWRLEAAPATGSPWPGRRRGPALASAGASPHTCWAAGGSGTMCTPSGPPTASPGSLGSCWAPSVLWRL